MNNQRIAIIVQSLYGIYTIWELFNTEFNEGIIFFCMFLFLILLSLKKDRTKKLEPHDLLIGYIISAVLIINISVRITVMQASNNILYSIRGHSWYEDLDVKNYIIEIISVSLPFFMYIQDKKSE